MPYAVCEHRLAWRGPVSGLSWRKISGAHNYGAFWCELRGWSGLGDHSWLGRFFLWEGIRAVRHGCMRVRRTTSTSETWLGGLRMPSGWGRVGVLERLGSWRRPCTALYSPAGAMQPPGSPMAFASVDTEPRRTLICKGLSLCLPVLYIPAGGSAGVAGPGHDNATCSRCTGMRRLGSQPAFGAYRRGQRASFIV